MSVPWGYMRAFHLSFPLQCMGTWRYEQSYMCLPWTTYENPIPGVGVGVGWGEVGWGWGGVGWGWGGDGGGGGVGMGVGGGVGVAIIISIKYVNRSSDSMIPKTHDAPKLMTKKWRFANYDSSTTNLWHSTGSCMTHTFCMAGISSLLKSLVQGKLWL